MDEVFLIISVLFFGTIIITVLESILEQLLYPFGFYLGITIFKESFVLETIKNSKLRNIKIRKSEGKFFFSKDDKVFFVSRMSLDKKGRINSGPSLKSIGKFYANSIEINTKISLGSLLVFFLFSLIFVGILIISIVIKNIFLFFVITLIMVGLFHFNKFGYRLQKQRYQVMVIELKRIISEYNQ